MTEDRWGDDDATIGGGPVCIPLFLNAIQVIHGNPQQSSTLATLVLTYRQTIFISVYSHLLRMSLPSESRYLFSPENLVIDHYSDVWWRWTNVFFTLMIWAVELLVWGADDDDQHWKVD